MLIIAICEDNLIHAERLKKKIEVILDVPFEIQMFISGSDFLRNCKKSNISYDMIFMDIILENDSENGIQIAKTINHLFPFAQIIFISQYLEFAPTVYETKHIYFINKDRLDDYLKKAIYTALENISRLRSQYLYFRRNQKDYQVLKNEILYLERILRTTEIHIRGASYTATDSIPELLKQLSDSFILCHRSYAVNLYAITTFHRSGITLSNGQSLPVGRKYYDQVKKAFARVISSEV